MFFKMRGSRRLLFSILLKAGIFTNLFFYPSYQSVAQVIIKDRIEVGSRLMRPLSVDNQQETPGIQLLSDTPTPPTSIWIEPDAPYPGAMHPGSVPIELRWSPLQGLLDAGTVWMGLSADDQHLGRFISPAGDTLSEITVNSSAAIHRFLGQTLIRFLANGSHPEEEVFASIQVRLVYPEDPDFPEGWSGFEIEGTGQIRIVPFELDVIAVPGIIGWGDSTNVHVQEGSDDMFYELPDRLMVQIELDESAELLGSLSYGGQRGNTIQAPLGDARNNKVYYVADGIPAPEEITTLFNSEGLATIGLSAASVENFGGEPAIGTAQIAFSADVAMDSDNDADIDADDERAEYSENRVGALIEFNADDDNGDEITDYIQANIVGDDDLEPLELSIKPEVDFSALIAQLDFLSGGANVKIWKDAEKTDSISVFPHEISLSDLPLTYYVEGIEWNEESTEIIFSVKNSMGQVYPFATDTLRLYSGLLDIETDSLSTVGERPYVSVSGLPQNTLIEYSVYKNGSKLSTLFERVEDLFTLTEINTSTSDHSPGDVYIVEARADSGHVVLQTKPCTIKPGLAASISWQPPSEPIVADERQLYSMDFDVADDFGNPVEDDTQVHFGVSQSVGGNEDVLSARTVSGRASVTFTAPHAPSYDDEQQGGFVEYFAWADTTIEEGIRVDASPIKATLNAEPSVLDVTRSRQAILILDTNGQGAPAVTDGTAVFWTISNYAPGQLGTGTSVVQNGRATFTVYSFGARVGPAVVTATVGNQIFTTTLRFTSSAPLYVQIDDPVLVGSITEDEPFELVQTIVRPASILPEDCTPTCPDQIVNRRTVQQNGVTDVVVHGAPNTSYVVSLDHPDETIYVDIEGTDPNGMVQTNASGLARFRIRSTGAFAGTPEEYLKVVSFTVSENAIGKRSGDPPSWTDRIYLANQSVYTKTKDFVIGFFGGDTESMAGITGNVAGGLLIVADIGSVIKNGWRLFGLSKEKVNWIELTLSGLGLLTEVAVGVGELADAPISYVRAMAVFFGPTPFIKNLVVHLKKAIQIAIDAKNFSRLTRFGKYTYELVKNRGFLKYASVIDESDVTMMASIRLVNESKGEFAEAVSELVTGTTAVGKGISEAAATNLTQLMDAMPVGIRKGIFQAPDNEELIKGRGRVIDKGQVNADDFGRVFSNNIFSSTYTPREMIKELTIVSDAVSMESKTGLAKLVQGLRASSTPNPNSGNMGWRYHLEAYASILKDVPPGTSNIYVNKSVKEMINYAYEVSDIDLQIGSVYYQVKSSVPRDFYGTKAVNEIERWCRIARSNGATKIYYVVPTIPPPNTAGYKQIVYLINNLGFDIDFIPLPKR